MPITLGHPCPVLTIDTRPGAVTEWIVPAAGFKEKVALTATVEDLHADKKSHYKFRNVTVSVVNGQTLKVKMTCQPADHRDRIRHRSGAIAITVKQEAERIAFGPVPASFQDMGYLSIQFLEEPEYQVVDLAPEAISYLYFNYSGPENAFTQNTTAKNFERPTEYPDGWSPDLSDIVVETMGFYCVRVTLKRAAVAISKPFDTYEGTPTTSNLKITLADNDGDEHDTYAPVKVVYINIPDDLKAE